MITDGLLKWAGRQFKYFIWIDFIKYHIHMDRFQLGMLTSQKDAKTVAEAAGQAMNQNGEFSKKTASEFLDAIYVALNSPDTSATSKTMTMHVLKELTYQSDLRLIGLLSTHKTLLDFLANEAKTVDPKKNMNDKGLKKFPGSPELGREYMRVMLELLVYWGEKYAKAKTSDQQTKYKKILNELRDSGVVLPSNNQYFDPNQCKSKSRRDKQGATPGGEMLGSRTGMGGSNDQLSRPTSKLSSELKYTRSKIQIFLSDLTQNNDSQILQSKIHSNHTFFQKDKQKYDKRESELTDEDIQIEYLRVVGFVTEEDRLYNKYGPVNDWGSYITEVLALGESTFEGAKNQKSMAAVALKNAMQYSETKPYQASNQVIGQVLGQALGQASMPPPAGRSGTFNQPIDQKALLNNLYNRLEERSKSPHSGFKSVQMDMEKQKEQAKKNPMRRTTSRSPRNLGRSGEGGLNKSSTSNLRESKIHPIFSSPPNPRLDYKNYEGETVLQNKELTQALYSIKRDQGSRRFKISNFRQKNPLFENEQIQVGYKSQAVYETINDFNHFIMLNIFIGNKTDDGIKEFQVEYKADTNQLLYANPKSVDSIIPAGYQNKHDLMITPLAVPYALMTMHISYKFKNTGYMTSIVLPNSVLKFASYMKMTKSDFDSGWRSSKKYKTNPFKLCKQLAPDSFNKWIPVLQPMTKYSQFSREGSETDLQLFCMVIMLQKYEAVLKINVRPNLDVVVQMGVLDSNPEGMEYFKFYLESLELMLKDFDI